MKKVRKIEMPQKDTIRKLRVAAYCRVSTKYESQKSSIELQKEYYESYIKEQPPSFREAILDEYDTDVVFKIEHGKSDLTTWKQVFNFALLNVIYGIDALHSRIESRDKHLFDAGMISEQAMARTLYMIKELTDKLDAYGVEPS